jgi:hypothetical protein
MDLFKQLRERFDGDDLFVAGGHSVGGVAGTRHQERIFNTPAWVNDNTQIRSLLLKVFPKLETDEKQRMRASKWLLIIYLYFRRGLTSSRIALELKTTDKAVRNIIYCIRRAAKGLRTDTGKPRGLKPRGRPQKR